MATFRTTYRVETPDIPAARELAWNAYIQSFTLNEEPDVIEERFRTLAAEMLRLIGHPEQVPHQATAL